MTPRTADAAAAAALLTTAARPAAADRHSLRTDPS
jgi:hypothetical protein